MRVGLTLLALATVSIPVAAQEKCRNEIPTLGGSTAILRKANLGTAAALKEVMEKEKYRKAFEEILDQAGLDGQLNTLLEQVKALTDDKKENFAQGTELAWMSYRRSADRQIRLLRDACWVNPEEFWAWPITLVVDGRPRKLIIPEDCLNLAELKTPTCTIVVQADCSGPSIKAEVTTYPVRGTNIESVTVEYSLPGQARKSASVSRASDNRYDATVSLPEGGGTYTFYAKVKDNNRRESPECTGQASVCSKPCEPTEKPCEHGKCTCNLEISSESWITLIEILRSKKLCNTSCELEVSSEWKEGEGLIRIKSTTAPLVTDEGGVAVEVVTTGEGAWTARVKQPGKYEVKAAIQEQEMEPLCSSTCSTTVEVKAPECPGCQSPWMLRTFGLYMASQGSEQSSSFFQTAGNQGGELQFEFNDGLGFGFEFEHRYGKSTVGGGWGWAAGLSQASIDTFWVFDPPSQWIMDNDRVDLTILTTGPRFHWGAGGWRWFAGPSVGYALFSTGSYADGTMKPGTFEVDFDDTLVYGGGLGFDALLSEDHCWGFTGGLEYLVLSAEGRGLDVDVNPLSAKIGIVYHF